MWRCPSGPVAVKHVDKDWLEMPDTCSNRGWQLARRWRPKGDAEQTIGTWRIRQGRTALVRRIMGVDCAKTLRALCRADLLPRVCAVANERDVMRNGRHQRRPKNGCNGQPFGQFLMRALQHQFILSSRLILCASKVITVSDCSVALRSTSPA